MRGFAVYTQAGFLVLASLASAVSVAVDCLKQRGRFCISFWERNILLSCRLSLFNFSPAGRDCSLAKPYKLAPLRLVAITKITSLSVAWVQNLCRQTVDYSALHNENLLLGKAH